MGTKFDKGSDLQAPRFHFLKGAYVWLKINSMLIEISISAVSLLFLLGNLYFVHSPAAGTVAITLYFLIGSRVLGETISGILGAKIFKPLVGLSFFIILFGFPGAAFIDFYRFSNDHTAVILILLDVLIIALTIANRRKATISEQEHHFIKSIVNLPRTLRASILIFIALSISGFFLLASSRTGSPVPILWDKIIPLYAVAYLALTFLVGLLVLSSHSREHTRTVLFLVIIHSLVLHSYMSIVYGTIYGGDQWYHMANEEQIIRTGTYGPVLFGEGPWKELKRGELFQGMEEGKLYVKIGGFNIPYAFISGKVSYTFLYSVSLSFSQLIAADVFFGYWLLVPILWSLVVPVILCNIGRLLSWDESRSLLLAFLPSFFYFLNIYGANTVPISLGIVAFFPSLLTWLNYLVNGDSKSLMLAVALTLILYFNYSLVWVLSIMIGILTIAFRFLKRSRKQSHAIIIIPLLFVLITAIPILDTLENRTSFIPELTTNPVHTVFSQFNSYLGERLTALTFSSRHDPFYEGVMYKIQVSNRFNISVLYPILLLMTAFLWVFVVVGILKAFRKRRSGELPMLLMVVFFLILELSTFAVWYLMKSPHALGLRLNSFRQIFMLFPATLGVMCAYEYMKATAKRVKAAAVLTTLLIAFSSTSFYTMNPISQNIASYEMDAVDYIYKSNPGNDYVVITWELPELYLRKISANEIIGGNFPIYTEVIGGVVFERSIGQKIYENMTKWPTVGLMQLALSNSLTKNVSKAYLLLDSRFYPKAFNKASLKFPVYRQFDSLRVFEYKWSPP